MRGTALCCALLLCGGCSLFLSTSDLANDTPDGGGPIDAAVDGPPVVVGDGGIDTGTSAEAGGPFCQSLSPAPKLCADFDDNNLLSIFDDVLREPSTTTTVVAEEGGVRAAIDGATGCAYARLAKTIQTNGAGMRIRFKMKPSAPWVNDEIHFILNLEQGAKDCGFFLHLGDGAGSAQLHVQWGSPEQNDGVGWAVLPKVGEWNEIAIELGTTDPPTVAIAVNGKPSLPATPFSQCSFGSRVYVGMGFHCSSGTAEARYDDLVIDYP